MKKQSGFTLVELLAVLAIVAVLIALLTSGVMAARERAKDVVCMARLRLLGTAFAQFAQDHNGRPFDIWPEN